MAGVRGRHSQADLASKVGWARYVAHVEFADLETQSSICDFDDDRHPSFAFSASEVCRQFL